MEKRSGEDDKHLARSSIVLSQSTAPYVRITLPFKDQKSAEFVRRQLSDLGKKINPVLKPVFASRKISEDLKLRDTKPLLVNQKCVVYEFECNSCDSNYAGAPRAPSTIV